MALQVWLPFDKDLNNHGLSNIFLDNTGTAIDDNGKIGKCMKITSSKSLTYIPDFNTKGLTLCGWFKFNQSEIDAIVSAQSYTSTYKTAMGNLIGNNNLGGIGIVWETNDIYTSGSFTTINIKATLRTSTAGNKQTSSFNIEFDKWIYIILTWNPNTHILSLYKNGILHNSISNIASFTDGVNNPLYINYNVAWAGSHRKLAIPIYINDIRVYNHCLSIKEIHEISKGLALHYKLDANGNGTIGNTNLVKNGWGGTENWSNTNYSTTEIPSVDGITHSYYDCNTIEFIPIISNHTYELSCYVKSKTGTGTCYVSLIPYDIDKNQITYEKTAQGFRASSLTTLSEDLKSGDTIVHLTDASGWANPSTHQYVIAIFGYTDSTGYTYPDLVYTRRTYAYGTSADKSHLNIANNTVTLNSAYNGPTIAKGTSVCLTGYGGTYYYPINVSAANASDWVLKSTTIIPQNIAYLKPAKYVRVISISGYQYLAGITLKDTSVNNIIYDCSGYRNHGNIIGQMTIDANTPRYNYAIYMNNTSTDNRIETDSISLSDNIFTISFWIKTLKSTNQVLLGINSKMVIGLLNSMIYLNPESAKGFIINDFIDNDWNHIVAIRNDSTFKLYVNNILCPQTGGSNTCVHNGTKMYLLNRKYNNNYAANALMSDLRIYCTELSEDDIKELYDTPTFIDNQGDLMSFEFDDLSNNMIELENYGIDSKQWLGGLTKAATQVNCQCTLEDDGYRIYRPPNITYNASDSSTKTMWGGLVLRNTNNRFGFVDGHTYILEFDIKGQSSAAASDTLWSNNAGWAGGGLIPAPTNAVMNNPVTSNFNSQEWNHFSYKWTISDGVYKVCTSSYSTFVQGTTYISYRDFKFGFTYNNTGELGTDLYIKNLRMYDITTNKEINIKKTGITEAINFVEEGNETQFFKTNIINSTQLLEI